MRRTLALHMAVPLSNAGKGTAYVCLTASASSAPHGCFLSLQADASFLAAVLGF